MISPQEQPKGDAASTSISPEPEPATQPQTQPEQEIAPTSQTPLPTTDSERTLVPPSSSISSLRLPDSPPSSSLLASTSSPPAPAVSSASGSLKRRRESEADDRDSLSDVDMDEERPTRRARTASYVPEDKDAPNGLGWFLLPFKAFVEGFRQSLTTLDS